MYSFLFWITHLQNKFRILLYLCNSNVLDNQPLADLDLVRVNTVCIQSGGFLQEIGLRLRWHLSSEKEKPHQSLNRSLFIYMYVRNNLYTKMISVISGDHIHLV